MKNILILFWLTLTVSSFGQTYGWMIRIDPGQDADTANMGIMYPDGSGNLTGRMHFVSYATVLEKLAAFSPDTVYVNAGDSLVIVSIHGDTTYFAGGGGISNGDKGDITVSSGGAVWTIDNGLAATKIADGSVTNSEFQYLGSVTSDIQTQLNNKAASGANTDINSVALDNTGLRVKNGTKKLTIQPQGTITADRTIGIDVADANRILTLGGDLEVITGGAQVSGVNTGDQDLSGYSLDANVVHKTGDETINGEKTFNDSLRVDDYAAFLGTDGGYATKIEMLKNGVLQFDQDTAQAVGRYLIKSKPQESGQGNTDFNFTTISQPNTGISRNNDVFSMGWNLNPGGGVETAGKIGVGEQFEGFYRTAGSDYGEWHIVHIDTNGVVRKPISWFLNHYSPALWAGDFLASEIQFNDPTNNLPFAEFRRYGTTGVYMTLTGSASGNGTQFYLDDAADNMQITSYGMTNPHLYLFDNVATSFVHVNYLEYLNAGTDAVRIAGQDANGYLTDVPTGWGIDLNGSGTLLVDSSQVATQYDLTSKLNVSDTAAMLSNYIDRSSAETIYGVKTFNADPIVPAEAYGSGWNGSNEPPTKNDVYDKIETLGGTSTPTTISPSQLTSDQDNYNPTAFGKAKYIRISSDNGMRAITSMVDSTGGEHTKVITNIGSYMLYFPMDHPDGTAANRFTGNSGDIYLFPGQTREFYYDATSSRWRCVNYSMDADRMQTYYDASARSTSTGDNADLAFTAIGTGSAGNTAPTSPRPGYIQLSTASSGTAGYILSFVKTANTYTTYADAHIFVECQLFFPTLSDGTDTYTTEVQISSSGTSTTLEPNNSIGIRYSHGINSGKWELFSQSNTGTEATADLGVTVAANTVYKVRIEIDKANAEARAYINGSFAGRVASNVTATACSGRIIHLKSAGTTARTANVVRLSSGAAYPY